MISITELLEDIINGKLDPFKVQIMDAFKIRSKNKDMLNLMSLKPGMRVRLINCQKVLQGALGTITAINKSRVVVDLDKPAGRWHRGIQCPPGLLELVK